MLKQAITRIFAHDLDTTGTGVTKRAKALRVAAVGLLAFTPLTVGAGAASAANASPNDRINKSCGPRINVFQTTSNFVKDHTTLDSGATVNLSEGWDSTYGWTVWAHVLNGYDTDLGTDWVWMDWSDTPGYWHQCGPFAVDGSQGMTDRWTWGVNEVANRYFRACGMSTGYGIVHCTGWLPG